MPPDTSIVWLPFPSLKTSLEKAKAFGEEIARRVWCSQIETWQDIVLWDVSKVACPRCGVKGQLRPRGWQPRKLKSAFGEIAFRLRRATCQACGATASPIPSLLGLKPRQRVAPDIEDMAAKWVGKLPYAALSALLGRRVSPKTLRRLVLGKAEEWEIQRTLSLNKGGWVLFVDQTMVPVGPTHRGSHLTLCLAVTQRRRKGRRAALQVEVILLDTRMSLAMALETVALMLKGTPPSLIIHDGDPAITESFDRLFPGVPRQRCLWHLERGLGYALWGDKLPKDARRPFQDALLDALYSPSLGTAKRRYQDLVRELDRHGLHRAADFLNGAEAEAFTFKTPISDLSPTLARLTAQGPIERQMRELNRRADIGTRWSPEGLDAVLLLATLHRLDLHNLPFLETQDAA